ncbi:MAG: hypothetical protein R3Y63_06305 [Eubacteriales bacterium]
MKGRTVKSVAGHDKGDLFFVLQEEGEFFFLVNGRQRRLANPKRKKKCHVTEIDASSPVPVQEISVPQSDKEIRRFLASMKEVITFGKG